MADQLIRTPAPVRELTADELGIGAQEAIKEHGSSRPDDPPLAENDPMLLEVRELLTYFGGIILTGPPGTSKSWYAAKIAKKLADQDDERVRFVQFHPSYQYEDFVQGFVPKQSGDGFVLTPKHFLRLCREAGKKGNEDKTFVLVIDELSRGDPGRIFGEALTYVEKSKRGLHFSLASGEDCVVPPNLVVLGTMNPLDRGVDEVDAAFERRFAKIAMEPDAGIVANFLDANGVGDPTRNRILGFFNKVNGQARINPLASVGHTFFMDVRDEDSLRSLWDHQLRFLFEKAYRLDPESLRQVQADFDRIFKPTEASAASSGSEQSDGDGQAEGGDATDEET